MHHFSMSLEFLLRYDLRFQLVLNGNEEILVQPSVEVSLMYYWPSQV